MTYGEMHVLEPGFLTTVQDAPGRPGLGRFGIPPGGAMDAVTARLAGRLVGGVGDEPVLELTLAGPVLAFSRAVHIGLAGADLGAVCAGIHRPSGHSHRLPAGAILRFETGVWRGARAYLAVEGGFDVPKVLGSASTDRRTGFGGFNGRALAVGDVLRFGHSQAAPLRSLVGGEGEPPAEPIIRVIATPPDLGWFDEEAFAMLTATGWAVSGDADRSGIRLTGGRIHALAVGIPSLGVPVGAVQVPPNGEPIVAMVDGPVTGGYPVVGVVARADHGRLAQLVAGERVRFRGISVEEARRIARPEPRLDIDPGDAAAGWAG